MNSTVSKLSGWLFNEKKKIGKQDQWCTFLKILTEGKLDDIKARLSGENLRLFLAVTDLGNIPTKYFDWIASKYTTDTVTSPEELHAAILDYEHLTKKNIIKAPNNDITRIKSVTNLLDITSQAKSLANERETKEKLEKDYDVIFADSQWFVVHPKSMEASCKLGRDTQWCISAVESKNYFEEYTSNGAKFVFIINKLEAKRNPYAKIAIAFPKEESSSFIGSAYEIYNAEDDPVEIENIWRRVPEHILVLINKHFRKEVVPQNALAHAEQINAEDPIKLSEGIAKLVFNFYTPEQEFNNPNNEDLATPEQKQRARERNQQILDIVRSKTSPLEPTKFSYVYSNLQRNYSSIFHNPDYSLVLETLKSELKKKAGDITSKGNPTPTIQQQLLGYSMFGISTPNIIIDNLVTYYPENAETDGPPDSSPGFFRDILKNSTDNNLIAYHSLMNAQLLAKTLGIFDGRNHRFAIMSEKKLEDLGEFVTDIERLNSTKIGYVPKGFGGIISELMVQFVSIYPMSYKSFNKEEAYSFVNKLIELYLSGKFKVAISKLSDPYVIFKP